MINNLSSYFTVRIKSFSSRTEARPASAPPIGKSNESPPRTSRLRSVRKKKKSTQIAHKSEEKNVSSRDSSTSSDDDGTVKSESNANDDERTLIIKSTKELGDDVKKGGGKGLYGVANISFGIIYVIALKICRRRVHLPRCNTLFPRRILLASISVGFHQDFSYPFVCFIAVIMHCRL